MSDHIFDRTRRPSRHPESADVTHRTLADAGPRYNRFRITALCSPTRTALLTGRNEHHQDLAAHGMCA